MPRSGGSDDRLRLARLSHGYSQGDLAGVAGVTRQAISGIESGRWSPSLDVALSLAAALDSTVEELFGQAGEPPSLAARVFAGDEPVPVGQRVVLSEIGGETVAFPLERDRAFAAGFLPASGVIEGVLGDEASDPPPTADGRRRPSSQAVRARCLADTAPVLAIAGCDPALALLQGPLARLTPPVGLAWWACGNAAALELMQTGAVHAAAVHRGATGPRTSSAGTETVGFASWREGLACAPRLKPRPTGLADVVRRGLRIANREKGSEARRLLDEELARLGVARDDVAGYESECTGHLLVASAIAAGLADAGVTTEPAAVAFGLLFLPWQDEVCELHLPRSLLATTELRSLLRVLGGRDLSHQLETVAGYDATVCGKVPTA